MSKENERDPLRLTFEEATRLAKEIALEYGEHEPMLIAEGDSGSYGGRIVDLPDTHEERLQWMLAAGFTLSESREVGDLQHVFFISEGWLSFTPEGKPRVWRPARDPNRKSVLSISGLAVEEQRTQLVVLEMVRDPEGRLTELRDLALPGTDEGGRADASLLDAF